MSNSLKSANSLSEKLERKNIVIDTSSLLVADTDLLNVIRNTTLVIPAIVVKEIESKRHAPNIGYMARNWLRLIEELRVKHGVALSEGVLLDYPYENIVLRIEPNHSSQKSLPAQLQDGSNDSTILAVAKNLSDDKDVKDEVVVMSNDVPLLIHATVELKLKAYEYSSSQSYNAGPFDGKYEVEFSMDDLGRLTGSEKHILQQVKSLVVEKLPEDYATHAYIVVHRADGRNAERFIMTPTDFTYAPSKLRIPNAGGSQARSHEQSVALEYLKKSAEDLPIVSLGGGAGSGKTLLAVATALDALEKNKYQKVVAFRSLHEMGEGQEMGFLPGDVDEKMGPWAGAINDAIEFIATQRKGGSKKSKAAKDNQHEAVKAEIKRLKEQIEVSPITYLRGRSLTNTLMILEEAQNFSRSEILNILSRAGEGTKVILTFDSHQVDSKFLQTGDRADIWSVVDRFKKENVFAHVTLKKSERSKVAEIAAKILETE